MYEYLKGIGQDLARRWPKGPANCCLGAYFLTKSQKTWKIVHAPISTP